MLDDVIAACSSQTALEFPNRVTRRLYERAKDQQWDVDADIDWHSIELQHVLPSIRGAMADLYSQIQYSEVMALHVIPELVSRLHEPWAKLVGASQVMDEARHVEFFSRVVSQLGDAQPVRPSLSTLLQSIATAPTVDEIFLGTHIVVEGFAQTLFREGARASRAGSEHRIRMPGSHAVTEVLRGIESYVSRDESRHMAFGVLYLRERWNRQTTTPQRYRLQERLAEWSTMTDAVLADFKNSMRTLGIQVDVLRAQVERTRAAQCASIGIPYSGA